MVDLKKGGPKNIPLTMPDGTSKPIILRGPIAAEFFRRSLAAYGLDKGGMKGLDKAEIDPAKLDLSKLVEAVDALLQADHADLQGELSLEQYMEIFMEAWGLVGESFAGMAGGDSKNGSGSAG